MKIVLKKIAFRFLPLAGSVHRMMVGADNRPCPFSGGDAICGKLRHVKDVQHGAPLTGNMERQAGASPGAAGEGRYPHPSRCIRGHRLSVPQSRSSSLEL